VFMAKKRNKHTLVFGKLYKKRPDGSKRLG
jgi:hypothetical protein